MVLKGLVTLLPADRTKPWRSVRIGSRIWFIVTELICFAVVYEDGTGYSLKAP